MKLLGGIRISIEEIENGFIIDLYTEHGPIRLDKRMFVASIDEALDSIKDWLKKVEAQK